MVNSVRHSGGHAIDVIGHFDETWLRLEIRDDGRGFAQHELEQAKRRGHLGLSGARDRAALMNDRVEIVGRRELSAQPGTSQAERR